MESVGFKVTLTFLIQKITLTILPSRKKAYLKNTGELNHFYGNSMI